MLLQLTEYRICVAWPHIQRSRVVYVNQWSTKPNRGKFKRDEGWLSKLLLRRLRKWVLSEPRDFELISAWYYVIAASTQRHWFTTLTRTSLEMSKDTEKILHTFRKELFDEEILHDGDSLGTDDETLLCVFDQCVFR